MRGHAWSSSTEPIWGSNGHTLGERIHWNAHTRVAGGVQSLGGQYITTITHNLHNPLLDNISKLEYIH